MINILAVFVGAGLGALGRYALSLILPSAYLLVANVAGSFLAGISIALIKAPNGCLKTFIITGILGGFTTFSSFSIEIFALLQSSKYIEFFTTSALHLFGALAACALGYKIASF